MRPRSGPASRTSLESSPLSGGLRKPQNTSTSPSHTHGTPSDSFERAAGHRGRSARATRPSPMAVGGAQWPRAATGSSAAPGYWSPIERRPAGRPGAAAAQVPAAAAAAGHQPWLWPWTAARQAGRGAGRCSQPTGEPPRATIAAAAAVTVTEEPGKMEAVGTCRRRRSAGQMPVRSPAGAAAPIPSWDRHRVSRTRQLGPGRAGTGQWIGQDQPARPIGQDTSAGERVKSDNRGSWIGQHQTADSPPGRRNQASGRAGTRDLERGTVGLSSRRSMAEAWSRHQNCLARTKEQENEQPSHKALRYWFKTTISDFLCFLQAVLRYSPKNAEIHVRSDPS